MKVEDTTPQLSSDVALARSMSQVFILLAILGMMFLHNLMFFQDVAHGGPNVSLS
jgi:hypothetical protein